MAYSVLANLTPIYGLYCAIAPNLIYSFFGPSRESAVGAMALVSIMVGDLVARHTSTFPLSEDTNQAPLEERVNVAVKLAFLTGAIQVALGVLKLGEIATYVSHPVMQGFCAGGEILISISQLKFLFGINIPAYPYAYQTLQFLFEHIKETKPYTLLLGMVTFTFLFTLSRWRRLTKASVEKQRLAMMASESMAPLTSKTTKNMLLLANFGPFLAIILTGFIAYAMSLRGVAPAHIGKVPHGMQTYKSYHVSLDELQDLFGSALLLAVVSFMLTYSVSQKYAGLNNYTVEPNQELVALGLADFVGSFFGAFPVAGGFARTAVAVEANQQSQVSAMIAAIIVLLSVNFLTSSFYWIPLCTLAAIVQVAICNIVDFRPFVYAYRASKTEFVVMFATFAVTIGLGIDKGILVGVVLSIIALVRRTSHPRLKVLGALSGRRHVFRDVTRYTNAVQAPNIVIIRIDESINFASCASIKGQLLKIAEDPSIVLPLPPSLSHPHFPFSGMSGAASGVSGVASHVFSSPFRTGSPLVLMMQNLGSAGARDARGGVTISTRGSNGGNGNGSRNGGGESNGGHTNQDSMRGSGASTLPLRARSALGAGKQGKGEKGAGDSTIGGDGVEMQDVEAQEALEADLEEVVDDRAPVGEGGDDEDEDLEVSRALNTPVEPRYRPLHVVLDFSGVNHIDLSGIKMLDEVEEALQRGASPQMTYIVNVKSTVRDRLKKAPIWDRVGGELCYMSLPALLDHLVGHRDWAGEPKDKRDEEGAGGQGPVMHTPGGPGGGDDDALSLVWDGYNDWVI